MIQFLRAAVLPALLLAVTLPAAPLPAQQAAAAQQPLPPDPQLTTGQLENGLRYFIRRNERPEQRAELRLVVNAGSVLEDADQRGLAHFVEHMAFNGTRNFRKQELVDYLESIGMRFGPDLNAYTSFDETVYMLQVPTDDPAILARAFDILEDWAWGVTFDPEEIEKERGVVIEEWRGGRGARARMLDRQLPVLFRNSRYAERLPIGDVETLRTFQREALVRFYRDWYRPDLMAVVAVGDFEPGRVEALIRERFARVPVQPDPRPRPVIGVPGHAETLFAIAADPEATNTQVALVFKQEGRDRNSVAAYRQQLVERLYNRMLNARLFELTQKPDAPFIGGGSSQGRFVRSSEFYQLAAIVREGGAARGLEALLIEAERVRRHGFTAAELERHKTEMLRGMERAYAERDRSNSAVFASRYVESFLNGDPTPGIEWEFAMHGELLPGIGLADVNRLAQQWISDGDRVIMVSAPEKEGLAAPSEAELAGAFEAARRAEVLAYTEELSAEPLVASLPPAGRVVARSRTEDLDIHDWRLSNGVRVLLKPTEFKADEIRVHAFRTGGIGLAADDQHISALLAGPAVAVGGLGAFSAIDLRKVTAGKVASVTPWFSELEEGITGSASPQDVETFFELMYLTFTAPRSDPDAFQAFLDMQRTFLENRGASPEGVFSDTLQATLAQYHPRGMPFTAASLDQADLEQALAFYRGRFSDASEFTFVFVGNITPEELEPLALRYLATLPAAGRRHAWQDTGVRPPRGVIRKSVRKGLEPASRVQIVFTGSVPYTAEHRLALTALTEVLRIRLREVLREDLGGTYGVGVSGSSSAEPEPGYTLAIGFGTAPERLEELTGVLFGELERLKAEGPSELDIQKVREAQRRSFETNARQNPFWVSQLAFAVRWDPEYRGLRDFEARVAAIDAAMIRAAAERFLDTGNYVQVSLYPEAGADE
jgi:zinc protease